jgi:Hint module
VCTVPKGKVGSCCARVMGNGVVEVATKESATASAVAADGSCVPATEPDLCGANICAFAGSSGSAINCTKSGVQVPSPSNVFVSPASCADDTAPASSADNTTAGGGGTIADAVTEPTTAAPTKTEVVAIAGAGAVTTLAVPVEVTVATETAQAPPTVDPNASPSAASPVPVVVPENANACFPGSATVEVQDGSRKSMREVRVGDFVKVGVNEYSRVFMFTHRLADSVHAFLRVTVSTGETLSVTSGHFVYINGRLAAAETIKIGDTLELGSSGAQATVVAVATASMRGLYNPQTIQGDIVIDGILASTYTTAIKPSIAHGALAPLRALYLITGYSTNLLDKGVPEFFDKLVSRA